MPDLNLTRELATSKGHEAMMSLTQQMNLAPNAPMQIRQWGKQAFREGEPADMTGNFMHYNPQDENEAVGWWAEVRYADDCTRWVDMHLPRYPRGVKPPWILWRNVYVDGRDSEGRPCRHISHVQRSSDIEHYLEFIPKKISRLAYHVDED